MASSEALQSMEWNLTLKKDKQPKKGFYSWYFKRKARKFKFPEVKKSGILKLATVFFPAGFGIHSAM